MPIQPNDFFLVNTTTGLKKISYDSLFSGLDGGPPVVIGENAPVSPTEGDLWWADSTEFDGGGRLYIWTGEEWVDTSLPTGGGGDDGVETLGAIGDVTLTNLKNADIITWNGIRWVNSVAPPADISGNSINDLNDVDGSGASVGDILVWNNVAGAWQAVAQPTIPTNTSDLNNDSGFITSGEAPVQPGDIPTSTNQLINDSGFITSADVPQNTSELNNDSGFITDAGVTQIVAGTNISISPTIGTGQVIVSASGGGGAVSSVNGKVGDVTLNLNDINDVNLTNVQTSEIIAWSGTQWVNVSAPPADISGNSIGDLNDVDTTGVTEGDILVWNSLTSKWVPGTPSGGGGDGIPVGDTPPANPQLNDLWVDTDQCPPILLIYSDCQTPGNPDWIALDTVKDTPPPVLTWDAAADSYDGRVAASLRSIETQVKIRRCLVTNAGDVTYLDADDSTKLAKDWLRLCETSEISDEFIGNFGAEAPNARLRGAVLDWDGSEYNKGQIVKHNDKLWECLADATTQTPASGTTSADLTGSAGQVMVEIPRFSIYHKTEDTGASNGRLTHTFEIRLGTKTTQDFQVHPAFVRPDGSLRDHIYVSAYMGSGTNAENSVTGVNNKNNIIRPDIRTAITSRGAGWHLWSYWQYNAIQWLFITEYQDMNIQRSIGYGASEGGRLTAKSGESNSRGNRVGQKYTVDGSGTDFISYRGLENIYGRCFVFIDGINTDSSSGCYISNDYTKFGDEKFDDSYEFVLTLASGVNSSYVADVAPGAALLPTSTGGNSSKWTGDGTTLNSVYDTFIVGASSEAYTLCGIFTMYGAYYTGTSNNTGPSQDSGSRLAYAP